MFIRCVICCPLVVHPLCHRLFIRCSLGVVRLLVKRPVADSYSRKLVVRLQSDETEAINQHVQAPLERARADIQLFRATISARDELAGQQQLAFEFRCLPIRFGETPKEQPAMPVVLHDWMVEKTPMNFEPTSGHASPPFVCGEHVERLAIRTTELDPFRQDFTSPQHATAELQ